MNKWRWLLLNGLIIASAISCSPVSPYPLENNVGTPHTVMPTAKSAIAPATITPTSTLAIELRASAPGTRQWTAAPITAAQTITKEKAMPSGTPIPLPLDSGLQQFVRQAQEDLAKRLAVPVEQIELVEVL